MNGSGYIKLSYYDSSWGQHEWTASSLPIANNTWTHIAIQYTWQSPNSIQGFVNGAQVTGSWTVGTGSASPINSGAMLVGKTTFGGGYFFNGFIDEVRVSNNYRYSSNFTPQTTPFVRDEYTKLLLHFDENGDDPRNTGKAIDDSGNGNHGTITGAKYVSGLVGVDASATDTGKAPSQSYASHEGVFIEEGTTNKITNPSFEHSTYNTNWNDATNLTETENTTAPYYKFGSKSAKLVASADDSFYISINAGNTNTHTLSAYVYDGTSGNVGGTVSSSIAVLVFNGSAQTTTYTDMGGGWWRLWYRAPTGSGSQNYGVQVKAGKTIYLDGVQLEENQSLTSYADGSLGTGYSWSGTANESTSSRVVARTTYNSGVGSSDSTGSVSFWVKPNWNGSDGPGTQYERMSYLRIGDGGWGWGNGFTINSYTNIAGETINNFSVHHYGTGSSNPTVNTTITKDKWYHVVYVWNATTSKLYVNNTASNQATFNTNTNTGDIELSATTYGNPHSTTISDGRFYSDPLTESEIASLYYSGLGSHELQTDYTEQFSGQEGPVAFWKFDEGYGEIAYDSSNQGNNATISGALWSEDEFGSAPDGKSLQFDGVDDYVTKTYNDDIELDPVKLPFTVSTWFKAPSAVNTQQTLISRYSTSGYKLYMNASGQVCFGVDDDSTWGPDDAACSTDSFADSQWHFITAVKEADSINVYVDAMRMDTTTLTATGGLSGSNTTFYVGVDSDGSSNPWKGFIDEIRVYTYALNATQIMTEYAARGSVKGVSAGFIGEGAAGALSQGLVGYWKMDEASWNGTAGEVVDASGNANHGVRAGDATTASGKFGNGGTFDDSGDYVNLGSPDLLDNLTYSSFSTSAWIYQTGYNANTLVSKDAGGGTTGWEFYATGGSTQSISFRINTDSGSVTSTTANSTVLLSTWTHVTATYDNTGDRKLHIYVNGIESGYSSQGTVTGTVNDDSGYNLFVGELGNWDYGGKIDDLRIYNRALSPAEVQALYNWAPGLVAHWKLDENTGTIANDSSGNDNTGTLTNSPLWSAGKYGSAVVGDGTQKYVSAANTSLLNLSNNFTVGGWIKSNGSASDKLLNNYNTPLLQKVDSVDGYEVGLSSDLKPYLSLTNITKTWTRWDDLGSAACSQTEANDNGCLLNIGASGSWDQTHIMKPSVIKNGATYKMWYNGYSGSNYRIGYATSTDGTGWTKYDNLGSADCGQTEANDDGCVFNLGAGTDWDSSRVYNPSVIKDGDTYKMWYGGQVGSTARIGYATSTDGISWTRYAGNNCSGTTGNGCVFDKGATGSWDATWADFPSVIKDGDTYKMWYTGSNGTNYRIGYATSTDGINWTKYDNLGSADCGQTEANDNGCVFDKGGASTWDVNYVQHPSVFKDANIYHMIYAGTESGVAAQLGYATSTDGISWTRYDNTSSAMCGKSEAYDNGCILGVPGGTMWDKSNIAYASAFKEGETIKIYYGGHNGTNYRIGYASFAPGISDATAASSDTYHYLSATKDGTTLNLYVDGVLKTTGSTAVTTLTNTSNLLMGNLLNGSIDDIRIYNYARTQKQIVEDMNAGHPSVGSPVGSAVGYWKFDEGFGTTANSSSANNYSLTLENGVGWGNNGKFNKAGIFNGSNAHARSGTSDPFEYRGKGGMSLSAWVNQSVNESGAGFIITKPWNGSGEYNYWIKLNSNNTLEFVLDGTGSAQSWTTTETLADNIWTHIVFTVSEDKTIKIFLNGNLVKTGNHTFTNFTPDVGDSNINLSIGTLYPYGAGWGGNTDYSFDGQIDEVKHYGYDLSDDEVKVEYNRGSSIVLGSLSDTSNLTGGSVASNSATAAYCVPGSSDSCAAPVAEWNLDEGTGQSANDTSGNANTGTLGASSSPSTDDPTWSTGKISKGLSFDGSDDYVLLPSSARPTGAHTINLWIKPNSWTNATYPSVFGGRGLGTSTTKGGISLTRVDDNLRFELYDSDTRITSSYIPTSDVPVNNWSYLSLCWDGTEGSSAIKIYVNGILKQSASASGLTGLDWTSYPNFYLGYGYWNYFQGNIDNVSIFNYARTPAQIAWDYNRGKSIAHYKLDECSGTTLHSSNETYNTALNGTWSGTGGGAQTAAGDCSTTSTAWGNGATGRFNGSLNFDGTDDRVLVSQAVTQSQFSYAFWMKPSSLPESSAYVISEGLSYTNTNYVTLNSAGNLDFRIFSSQIATSNAPVSPNSWYHITGTYNGTAGTLYINGRQVAQASATKGGTPDRFAIGGGTSGTNYFSGQIDDVQIFNYALTEEQINNVYNGGAVLFTE